MLLETFIVFMEEVMNQKMNKKIYKIFKDNFPVTFKFSTFLSFILIFIYFVMVLVLDFLNLNSLFGFLILLLVIWFLVSLISPYLYSFFACNLTLFTQKGDSINFISFLETRKLGKRREIKGALKIYHHLAFAYLIYFAFDLLAVIIISIIASIGNNPIASFYNEMNIVMNDFLNTGNSEPLFNLIAKYQDLIYLVSGITNYVSLSFAFYYFLHSLTRSFANYYIAINNFNIAMVGPYANLKRVLKIKELNYNKGYYSLLYPYYIFTFVCFSSVYLLLYLLIPNMNLLIVALSAMVVTTFLLLPFLPLVLDYNHLKSEEIQFYFFKNLSSDISSLLTDDKLINKFGSEKGEELKKGLGSFKHQIDENLENVNHKNNDSDLENKVNSGDDEKKDN